MATWTIPYGSAVDFEFGGWAIPPGDAVDFDFGREQGGAPDPWADFRAASPGGTALAWGRLRAVDGGSIRQITRRRESRPVRPVRLPWRGQAPLHPAGTRLPWRGPAPADCGGTRLPWRSLEALVVPETRLPWAARLAFRDFEAALRWGRVFGRDRASRLPWAGATLALDFEARLLWGVMEVADQAVSIPWRGWKPPKDRLHRIFWGRELYARICLRGYDIPAGDAVDFDLLVPLSLVGDGDHVDFRFESLAYDLRCSRREPSGWRDNYFYRKPRPFPKTPKLVWRIIMNTATLIRTKDGLPVEVFSMDVKADIESWCWSFSAKIPAESLPLVSPEDGPVEVLATINGWSWRCMIESWSESRSFARGEYGISGRSASAELAAPYAPVVTGMNEAALTAVQITEEQLENTGWAIDWGGFEDWLVGAGALSYSNTSALKVVQMVAEATGGRILTHRDRPTLLVAPRLRGLPWNWWSDAPDLGISEYVVRQLGREFLPGIAYNAVFVSGERQGVICKVYRGDRAGEEKCAPMVTNALITDVKPAEAMGRMTLGRSGNWSRETLELPLTPPGELPGLLDIGMLVEMEENGRPWRGQVTGVSVSVAWTAGGGPVTRQNIDVERYRGK